MNAFTTVANACSLIPWGVTNPTLCFIIII